MPAYVDDPENPGKKIDVVELQRRDPHKTLPPASVRHWLRREFWTRREAIKLLSGYEPDGTPWSESDEGFSNIPTGQITYLDGLMAHWLSDAGLRHPLSDECLENFMVLAAYSKWSSLDERRTPRDWIDWAASKDFRPYWRDWAHAQGLLPEEQTAGRRETPPLKVTAQTDVVALPTAVLGPKTATLGNRHKPDWSVWRHAMKATLWDAVCLSCDTNPRAVPKDLNGMFVAELIPKIAASKEVRGEISRRLQIAESHAGTGGTLPTVTGGKDGEVYLATFAEWALNTMKWTVPDELQALAGTALSAEATAVGAPSKSASPDHKKKDKLDASQRAEIVRRANAGETQTALALEFGVTRPAIGKVVNKAKKHSAQRNDPFGRRAG